MTDLKKIVISGNFIVVNMKKYFIPFLILGTSLLYSCTEEAEEIIAEEDEAIVDEAPSNVEKVEMEFKAGNDAVSRTILTTDNAVDWETCDAISLFDPDSNNKFTASSSGASVTFTGSAKDGQSTYYASYPYNAEATISGSIITTTLPAEQTARPGSFANMLNPSVAKSGSDKTLNFKNACAVVKFTLGSVPDSKNIVKAMFRGNNGEALAGPIQIDASLATPVATVQTDFAGTEVTLNGEFTSGKTYYFVTVPTELTSGLTLVFYDGNNHEWKKVGQKSTTLTAGRILNLGEVIPGDFVPSQGYEIINDVYHIYNADGLIKWATQNDAKSSNVILQADIDMSGKKWTPIGSGMSTGYSGDFDGNGKYIKNLKVNVTAGNAGFFGGLAEGAKVHDIKFTGAEITGSSSVGVIAGESLGIIDRCNVRDSKVTGNNAGGITGNNSVQVNNCNVQDVTINGSYLAGGISAYNYGKIEYCTVSGNTTQITATGSSSRAGGIVASNSEESGVKTSGRILQCAVETVKVSGFWAGGIAGENGFGTVAQCVVDRSVITHASNQNSTRLGGVVGYNSRGEVVASYSAYTIVGGDGLMSEALGGIVAYNNSSSAYVYGCYSTHDSLLGISTYIGAIAGYSNGNVISCYADGADGISGVGLVGTGTTEHCVEIGETNYETLITGVYNLTVTDGTVWIAKKIWEIAAEGPSINADYIGELSSN